MLIYLAITMSISILIYYYFLDIIECDSSKNFVKQYGILHYYLVAAIIGPFGIPYFVFRLLYNIITNR